MALCLAAAVSATATVADAQCTDYATGPSPLGAVGLGGYSGHVTSAGDLAFVTYSDGTFTGIHVVDVGDPTDPQPTDSLGFASGDGVRMVVSDGLYAYTVSSGSGLRVYDLGDPAAIGLVAASPTPGSALGIALAGSLALVCDGDAGVQVFDISDPTSPAPVGSVDTPGSAYRAAVQGQYAYIADLGSGLQVVDFSDPTAPAIVGQLALEGEARQVDLSGDRLLVGGLETRVSIVDIGVPTAPQLLGELDEVDRPLGFALDGDIAVACNTAFGVWFYDMSDPLDPTVIGTTSTPVRAAGVEITGGMVFVSDEGSGLQVFDASALHGHAVENRLVGDRGYADVTASGTLAFGAGNGVFDVWDLTDAANPVIVGSTTRAGNLGRSCYSGQHVFAIEYSGDVVVIDVGAPGRPQAVANIVTPGTGAADIVVTQSLAYIADGTAGLLIHDASNPRKMDFLGGVAVPGFVRNVAVAGGHAYVGTSSQGLQVVDVGDPANPVVVGQWPTSGNVDAVGAVAGGVMVATGGRIQVLDVSDPTAPSPRGTLDMPGSVSFGNDLLVSGDIVYLAASEGATRLTVIIDVSHPEMPVLQGIFRSHWTVRGHGLSQDRLFITDTFHGALVLPLQCQPDPATAVPEAGAPTIVHGCSPNPFNPRATIRFDLPRAGATTLRIYDVAGRAVRTLVAGRPLTAGSQRATWDGRTDQGRACPADVYYYRIDAAGTTATGNMVLLK